jgi:MFS family permease
VIFTIAYSGFVVAQSIAMISVLFVIYGLYQGMFRVAGKALAADLVPKHLRASGVGWYSATVGLLQLVASLIAGFLWDRVGHTTVFLLGAVFGAVGCLALLALIPARPKEGGS